MSRRVDPWATYQRPTITEGVPAYRKERVRQISSSPPLLPLTPLAHALVPLTPGGIGVFETTMLATLALFGVDAEAAIPILGHRLFNFWLPIPLAAVFYPTLRLNGRWLE